VAPALPERKFFPDEAKSTDLSPEPVTTSSNLMPVARKPIVLALATLSAMVSSRFCNAICADRDT
jgi:hypothetical protein